MLRVASHYDNQTTLEMPHQTTLEKPQDARAACSRKRFVITTDGACWPNNGSGHGGWAFIIRELPNGPTIERNGYVPNTTNNQMELTAVFEAVSFLNDRPGSFVTIRSDSKYLINACTSWGDKWESNGWLLMSKGNRGQPVKNRDLIESIRDLCRRHTVRFEWVKGHAGDADNERCDVLATALVTRAAVPFK